MFLKGIKLHAKNTLTILSLMVNMIWGPRWPFDDHKNLHFDNE